MLYAHVSFSFLSSLCIRSLCTFLPLTPVVLARALSHAQTHSRSLKTSPLPSNAHFLFWQKRSIPLVHRQSKGNRKEVLFVSVGVEHLLGWSNRFLGLKVDIAVFKCRSRIKRDWIRFSKRHWFYLKTTLCVQRKAFAPNLDWPRDDLMTFKWDYDVWWRCIWRESRQREEDQMACFQ